MPIIVDGHNLLHSINKADPDSGSVSDVQLCRAIGKYLRLINEKGEVVFDGTGPRDKSGFDNIDNLEVSFAGARSDADTVIEDKIKANTAPKRLTIVSSDRRLRDAARKRKATVEKSLDFWDNLCKQLSRKRGIAEPKGKRHGLTDGETDLWLKIFDLEE
ncbi:MAG: NYN domain-containing protein [Phycisphaerae bacterium]|nr:NYN domain-containing protein [Phycisphaerae bacterium]